MGLYHMKYSSIILEYIGKKLVYWEITVEWFSINLWEKDDFWIWRKIIILCVSGNFGKGMAEHLKIQGFWSNLLEGFLWRFFIQEWIEANTWRSQSLPWKIPFIWSPLSIPIS